MVGRPQSAVFVKGRTGMQKPTIFVGLDVHQDLIVAAPIREGSDCAHEVRRFGSDYAPLRKYLKKLQSEGEIATCYEAGACGYGLHRRLEADGVLNYVIAPSLIPKKPGDRIKTDKRDAQKLAKNLKNGDLTPVAVPTEEEERVRGLVRCRDGFGLDVGQVKNQILKFCQFKGVKQPAGKKWSKHHRAWLRSVELAEIDRRILNRHLDLLKYLEAELEQLDAEIDEIAKQPQYSKRVDALRVLRGIDTLSAMILVVEIGDIRRFAHPLPLMAYTGLVPSLHASGGPGQGGPITRTGNRRLRRILVESAWHARHLPTLGGAVGRRLQEVNADAATRIFSKKVQTRLHKKFWKLSVKSNKLAVTAVARELVGFVWAALRKAEGLEA